MEECLIFPYGGATKWIDLSLREYPNVDWLILLANEPRENIVKLVNNNSENGLNSGDNEGQIKDYYQHAKNYINSLKKIELSYPKPKRRKLSVLKVPNFSSYFEFLSYFRALFFHVKNEGSKKINIHINSGLMMYRIALYQCAEEYRDMVGSIYMFDKVTGEIEKIRIYRDLNDTEKNLLSLLMDQKKKSITKLRDLYEKKFSKKTLSYILKMINRLNKEGLVEEYKEGRIKFVKLSPFGNEFLSIDKYKDQIKINIDL